jgi:hypothetical protein
MGGMSFDKLNDIGSPLELLEQASCVCERVPFSNSDAVL